MRILLAVIIFLLLMPIGLADDDDDDRRRSKKVKFDYEVTYSNQFTNWNYTGLDGQVFYDVPVFISGRNMDFQVSLTARKKMKDVMVIAFQEYYCLTDPWARKCIGTVNQRMNVPIVTSFHKKIKKGQTVQMGGSLTLSDGFSSLDKTHLMVIKCRKRSCEKYMDNFWEYYQDYLDEKTFL